MDIFRDSDLAITLADPASADCGLVFANGKFEEITGHAEQSVLGRNCRFLQSTQTSRHDIEKIRKGVHRLSPVTRCIMNTRKSGEPFWNLLTIVTAWRNEMPMLIGCQHDLGQHTDHRAVKAYTQSLFTLIEHATGYRSGSWETVSSSLRLQVMSVFMIAMPRMKVTAAFGPHQDRMSQR